MCEPCTIKLCMCVTKGRMLYPHDVDIFNKNTRLKGCLRFVIDFLYQFYVFHPLPMLLDSMCFQFNK